MIDMNPDTFSTQYIHPFVNSSKTIFDGGWLFSSLSYSYLFNYRKGTSLLLSNDLVEHFKKEYLPNDLEIKLIQRGFITVDNVEAIDSQERIMPTFFLIDLTKSCNCRCIYCFRDLNQSESITTEKLDDVLSYIVAYCKKINLRKITIQPWGGEPLIKWNEIKRIQDVILENGIEVDILLETNALLLTKEIAKEAFSRKIKISISIDGFEKIHNEHRKLYNGKDSFKAIMENLHHLYEVGYRNNIGVVCVATSKSLPYIENIIDYIAFDLKMPRIKINMVKDNPMIKQKNLCIENKDIPSFQQRILTKIVDINNSGTSFGESNIVDRLHNLLSRKALNFCNSRGCQAGKRMLSFGLDGGIYPCDLTDNKELMLGTIYDNRELIPTLQKNRQQSHPFFVSKKNENCKTCLWNIFCKGGCTTAMLNNGKNQVVDMADCIRNQILYPLLIELMLSRPHLIKSITGNEIKII
jgi:uncharacterized protein